LREEELSLDKLKIKSRRLITNKHVFVIVFFLTVNLLSATYIYQGKVYIKPKKQFLKAEIFINYKIKNKNQDKIQLILHRGLKIKKIECQYMTGFSYVKGNSIFPFALEARTVVIKLNNKYKRNNIIPIHLLYEGKIEIVSKWKVNRITEKFVELGVYSSWFPFNPDIQPFSFNIDLMIGKKYSIITPNKEYQKRK